MLHKFMGATSIAVHSPAHKKRVNIPWQDFSLNVLDISTAAIQAISAEDFLSGETLHGCNLILDLRDGRTVYVNYVGETSARAAEKELIMLSRSHLPD